MLAAPTAVEYVPAEQLRHVCDGKGRYDPALQVWHDADDGAAILSENDPILQLTHVSSIDAPVAVEYVPAEQLLHTVAPDAANVPAPHVWHTADDGAAHTVEKEPDEQLRHDALLFACVVVEYAPAGQAVHAVAYSDDAKVPATHTTHAADDAAAGVAVYAPRLQLEHVKLLDAPTAAEYEPRLQLTH